MKKGILLCGGLGTRLRPATYIYNKHLALVYSKPMVLYPLEALKSLGINDILLVTGGDHIGAFADFLGDGAEYGVKLTYKVQKEAGGIAQALGLAKDFAAGQGVYVMLGDNYFEKIKANIDELKAHLFLKSVPNPRRFGVAQFDQFGKLINIQEKPLDPPSEYAITGVYYYPNEVFEIIPTLTPSARGELEITDINNYFIDNDLCDHTILDSFWSDMGTPESLLQTATFISKQVK